MISPLALAAALAVLPPPPETPRRPVTDAYGELRVVDEYRWLEDGRSAEVRAWSKAQDARTRAWLSSLPDAKAIRARVRALLRESPPKYFGVETRGEVVFALKHAPPAQQPVLIRTGDPTRGSAERTIVDPNRRDPSGATTIDFYEPSPDGRLVAVSLSKGGTEDGTLHVFEVASGKELEDRLPRVNGGTAGGGVSWRAGSDGFWYTRYPATGERPGPDLAFFQEVWFHRLGSPLADDVRAAIPEAADPRIAEHFLRTSDDGRAAVDLVQKGDGGEYDVFVRVPGSASFTRLARLEDRIVEARFGPDGVLYLVSRKASPRGEVLRVPLDGPEPPSLERATTVARASDGAAIDDVEATASRLYVTEIAGGPSRLRVLSKDGAELDAVPLPPVSSVLEVRRLGTSRVLYASMSFVQPRTWSVLDEERGRARVLPMSTPARVDFSDAEVVREVATSKDGTSVPMTIIRRKGTRADGKSPTILYGYGGYGISVVPAYQPLYRMWLDQGGVYVVANLRGGGEYGDAWHRAGHLERKQNVFDDFAACAARLVELKVTSPERLALLGGSNGGLLVGAAITQHPAAARAAVAAVGIFDMLRVELHPNGAFNVTEFGTVKVPSQLRALHAYSPLHHVEDGTRYPAVLLTAGDADPRVDAYHARKMAARLQAATASGLPVLLRVSGSGHGIGSGLDEIIEERADIYTFFLHELGVSFRPRAGPLSSAAGPRPRTAARP